MKVSVITPTGDRKEQLILLNKWIRRQTFKVSQWIVVDDGRDSYKPEYCTDYIKNDFHNGKNTIAKNLLSAMKCVESDYVLIMEDDDYYKDYYVQTIIDNFDAETDLIGFSNSVYWHVPSNKIKFCGNKLHGSLFETAIKRPYFNLFVSLLIECEKTCYPWIDLRLWSSNVPASKLIPNLPRMSVGIKGLPGRAGAGKGHSMEDGTRNTEYVYSILGGDYRYYEQYVDKEWKPPETPG